MPNSKRRQRLRDRVRAMRIVNPDYHARNTASCNHYDAVRAVACEQAGVNYLPVLVPLTAREGAERLGLRLATLTDEQRERVSYEMCPLQSQLSRVDR